MFSASGSFQSKSGAVFRLLASNRLTLAAWMTCSYFHPREAAITTTNRRSAFERILHLAGSLQRHRVEGNPQGGRLLVAEILALFGQRHGAPQQPGDQPCFEPSRAETDQGGLGKGRILAPDAVENHLPAQVAFGQENSVFVGHART